MFTLMAIIFAVGYITIVLEHQTQINKTGVSLVMGSILWAVYAVNAQDILAEGLSHTWNIFNSSGAGGVIDFVVDQELSHHLSEVSSILFFMLGAMGIVEVIDRFQGFRIITSSIKTRSYLKLTWIIVLLTFFMSAVLDNLTTTIVMVTLARKLVEDKERRWLLVSLIVIAANAGGAWSPIGDITTIMLWIGGQVTSKSIISALIGPCFITLLIPLIVVSFRIRNIVVRSDDKLIETESLTTKKEQIIIFSAGVIALLMVPIFKTYTHLPPYMGMLLGLGLMWIITDRLLVNHPTAQRELNLGKIIKHLDTPTVFFFMGILMSVAALSSAGHLDALATKLNIWIGNPYAIDFVIGLLSSTIDNASLVAGTMGMYEIAPADSVGYLADFTADGEFWTFLAYCAGTGGSTLIIGSAAGVTAMGMEKISFGWYFKKISWLALLGFIGGAATYLLIN